VSGGEAGAVEAVLSIMVGGEQADFDEAKPLFEALGKTVRTAAAGEPVRW
jgi:2-hydroxy-3-oxopropionate reductase